MKQFFLDLLNASNDTSSKRFISIYCLLLFTIILGCIIYGIHIPDTVIYSLVSLILGSSVMTLTSNNNNINK